MDQSNLPIIVVCTEGAKSSEEIINNLRKVEADKDTVQLCENVIGYKFHNVTKYYENDIVFLSHETDHINLIPIEILDRVEGCIIYFDSDNKDFLHKLPIYASFIEKNNIEFGILLCSELFDNPIDGITYKEGKMYSHILDVIELDRKHDDNDDEERSAAAYHHDPIGYDEVLQAIRAIIWSNVNFERKSTNRMACNGTSAASTADAESNNIATANISKEETAQANEDRLSAELSNFEQLLTEVMMFKETTASWSRNERLAYAEKFADAFDNLLQKDSLAENSSGSEPESET